MDGVLGVLLMDKWINDGFGEWSETVGTISRRYQPFFPVFFFNHDLTSVNVEQKLKRRSLIKLSGPLILRGRLEQASFLRYRGRHR